MIKLSGAKFKTFTGSGKEDTMAYLLVKMESRKKVKSVDTKKGLLGMLMNSKKNISIPLNGGFGRAMWTGYAV